MNKPCLTKSNVLQLFASLFLLPCVVSLTACDGGIFGTGDGDNPVLTTDQSDSGTANEQPNVASPTTVDETSFTNDLQSNQRDDALIRLVHAGSGFPDSIIMSNLGDTDSLFVPTPGVTYEDGQTSYLSLDPAATHDFDLFQAQSFLMDVTDEFASINPLVLAAGSATTIIARGTTDYADTTPEVLVLRNMGATESNNGFVRVIHAASHFSRNGDISIYVVAVGTDLADVPEPTLAMPLSYASFDSGYIELAPGQYEFAATDANSILSRISGFGPLDISSGKAITLVIRDDLSGASGQDVDILVLEDSTFPLN